MGDPLSFSSFSSCLSQPSGFSFARVLAPVQFPLPLRSILSCSSSLPTVKNPYTFLTGPNSSRSSGESAERFALFWTRTAVRSFHRLSHRYPRLAAPLPRYFLRRIFAGVFPLSSRKKFFYNFRIVLFRSSLFFQPRASRSPQVGFTPPSSVALPTAAHVRLCFLLSRFHFVQPFLCFPHGLSLIPVAL